MQSYHKRMVKDIKEIIDLIYSDVFNPYCIENKQIQPCRKCKYDNLHSKIMRFNGQYGGELKDAR